MAICGICGNKYGAFDKGKIKSTDCCDICARNYSCLINAKTKSERINALEYFKNKNTRALELQRAIENAEKEEAAEREKEQRIIEKDKQLDLIRIKNPKYEYKTVVVADEMNGGANIDSINTILNSYASQGWKLHTAFTNELGKNTSSGGYGGVSMGSNATIDEVILIFERCIDPGSL